MKWCSLNKCPTNNLSHKDRHHIPHFLFPRDPLYSELWVKFCENPKPFNTATHRMCLHHFTQDQFERNLKSELLNLNSRPKLKTTAIPTIKACDVSIIKPGENHGFGQESDILASIANRESATTTMSLKKFSREYENRKMKREIYSLKQKILGLERLNAAFREENRNLKRAVIEAEKTTQTQTVGQPDVEEVLVLPGFTVVLYK